MDNNIVLVTIDSLRADHCGYIEQDNRQLTPFLNQLAESGIAYEKAFAPGPRTPSSIPPVITGEFHQYRDWGQTGDWRRRRERIGTHLLRHQSIAEYLNCQGYDTAAYTTNPWTAQDTNFHTGFRIFKEVTEDNVLESSTNNMVRKLDNVLKATNNEDLFGWKNKREWFSQWPNFYNHIESIIKNLEEPYFLWIFLLDCHQPYFTPSMTRSETTALEMYYSVLRYWNSQTSQKDIPAHVDKLLKKSYRDTVRSIDVFLEKLIKDTEADEPRVIIHADHGEAHGEHGTYGHEKQLYDVNLHVPLVIYNTNQNKDANKEISLRMLPQIILDLSNQKEFDPKLYTQNSTVAITEFAEKTAVRGYGWKYIQSNEKEPELYNVNDDPREINNCANDFPEVATAFQNRINRIHSDLQKKNTLAEYLSSRT